MLLDVRCAFLYGTMSRTVYIELPRQDKRYGSNEVGKLVKAMYGTRDAPQIWQNEVRGALEALGLAVSVLQPSLYYHRERELVISVHVDECSGRVEDLEWLYQGLKAKYDLKREVLRPEGGGEGKYLNRVLRWTSEGLQI